MLLPLWYAIILGCLFAAIPIILYRCSRLYPPPKYSILTRTISGLGSLEHPKSAKFFNPMMVCMGIIMSFFPYFLLQVLPPRLFTYIGIGALFVVAAGLIMVGLFPEEKETAHMTAAFMCLGGSLISNIFLLYPILLSDLSIAVTIAQIAVLIVCVPLAISAVKTLPTYEADQPISKLLLNLNIWEWSQFITLQIWLFIVYLNLLMLP